MSQSEWEFGPGIEGGKYGEEEKLEVVQMVDGEYRRSQPM
jgi:hypothetical protein